MEYDLKPLKEKMVAAKVYDGWQYIQSAINSSNTAQYCMDIIDEIITRHQDTYNEWLKSLHQEMAEKKAKGENAVITVTIDRLPIHSIDVAGKEISSNFLLQKLTNDFFQYSRNIFDYIAQVANAVCLKDKGLGIENVDFAAMRNVFDQQKRKLPNLNHWFDQVCDSKEYKYLDDFCNRTKHISDIYVNMSISIGGGESKATVNPFYKKKTDHPTQDIKTYLKSIYDYVFNTFIAFLKLIEAEIETMKPSVNRYHHLMGYQQVIKESPENSFAYAYIAPSDNNVDNMPYEIGILLLYREEGNHKVFVHNCSLNTIYITAPEDKFSILGKYEAIDDWQPDQVYFYRKYRKKIPSQNEMPLFEQIKLSSEHRNMRFFPSPYMTLTSIET